MKKQILITIAVSLAQGIIAMDPLPPHAHTEGLGEYSGLSYAVVYEDPLYIAAEKGDYSEVERLLKAGADVNAKGAYEESALAAAVREGKKEVVKLLVKNGANIDIPDETGMTPILKAASMGDEELVMLLLTTPNRTMIESAIAAFNAIQRIKKPTRDIRWLLKQEFITQLVEDQMNRIVPALNYNTTIIRSLMLTETGHVNENLLTLLNAHNPTSVPRIRAQVKENIERIILGEPRQQAKPVQNLSQE